MSTPRFPPAPPPLQPSEDGQPLLFEDITAALMGQQVRRQCCFRPGGCTPAARSMLPAGPLSNAAYKTPRAASPLLPRLNFSGRMTASGISLKFRG